MEDIFNFFNLAFRDGEVINVTFSAQNKGDYTDLSQIDLVNTEFYNYLHINPLKNNTSRCSDNISEFRNFVFEFDDISLGEQLKKIKQLKLPFTALLFSGNKSIHIIICLTKGISRAQYLFFAGVLKRLLGSDMCCIPWALCRVPNKRQCIIDIKDEAIDPLFLSEWINWHIPDSTIDAVENNAEFSEEEIMDYLYNYVCSPHTSHNLAVASVVYLRKKETPMDTITKLIITARINTTQGSAGEAERDAYKILMWAENNEN